MALALIGLVIGALVGYSFRRWWALVLAIVLPLPWYLGIALGFWGNGFGENWQYAIPVWVAPVVVGYLLGRVVRTTLDKRSASAAA